MEFDDGEEYRRKEEDGRTEDEGYWKDGMNAVTSQTVKAHIILHA